MQCTFSLASGWRGLAFASRCADRRFKNQPVLIGTLTLLVGLCSSAGAQPNAPNEWTWMGGSNFVMQQAQVGNYGEPGGYGATGIVGAGNIPGGRNGAASATDSSGNFWLVGGFGYDANGTLGLLNDLSLIHI